MLFVNPIVRSTLNYQSKPYPSWYHMNYAVLYLNSIKNFSIPKQNISILIHQWLLCYSSSQMENSPSKEEFQRRTFTLNSRDHLFMLTKTVRTSSQKLRQNCVITLFEEMTISFCLVRLEIKLELYLHFIQDFHPKNFFNRFHTKSKLQ